MCGHLQVLQYHFVVVVAVLSNFTVYAVKHSYKWAVFAMEKFIFFQYPSLQSLKWIVSDPNVNKHQVWVYI